MKNIGAFIRKYPVKGIYSFLYLFPATVLGLAGILLIIQSFRAPAEERTWIWIAFFAALLLVVILLVRRKTALPKYSFEAYEGGLHILYNNKKKAPAEILFTDITGSWAFSTRQNNRADAFVFQTANGPFYLISSKYSNSGELIQFIQEKIQELQTPEKEKELAEGKRLYFPVLPEDGQKAILSEKAIIPYLQKAQTETVSLDRFSLYDGEKTYAISAISRTETDATSGNIHVMSTTGTVLYTRPYLSICNAALFVSLLNRLGYSKPTDTLTNSETEA